MHSSRPWAIWKAQCGVGVGERRKEALTQGVTAQPRGDKCTSSHWEKGVRVQSWSHPGRWQDHTRDWHVAESWRMPCLLRLSGRGPSEHEGRPWARAAAGRGDGGSAGRTLFTAERGTVGGFSDQAQGLLQTLGLVPVPTGCLQSPVGESAFCANTVRQEEVGGEARFNWT